MMLLGSDITQAYVFLLFAAAGVVTGGVYRFLYALTAKGGFWAVFVDIAVGVAAVVGTLWLNIVFNNGEARLYVYVAELGGALVSAAICGKPLDKLSARLYNRFTSKNGNEEQNDGTTVSQKVNGNIDDGGNPIGGAVALRVVDYAVANDLDEGSRRNVAKTVEQRQTKQRRKTGIAGLHKNRRIRRQMGGRTRLD